MSHLDIEPSASLELFLVLPCGTPNISRCQMAL
jgi:hypothetical protein